MKLYHGSYLDIECIDLRRSMRGKDFGQGFYLSADYQQAFDIAKIRCLGTNYTPCVNCYEFDESWVSSGSGLKVKRFDSYSLEWADFVLLNRQNKTDIPVHSYDIVMGPIANDTVGRQIRLLLDGLIDKQTFLERLKYMKGITFQYYFGTEKAIQYLTKIEPHVW